MKELTDGLNKAAKQVQETMNLLNENDPMWEKLNVIMNTLCFYGALTAHLSEYKEEDARLPSNVIPFNGGSNL